MTTTYIPHLVGKTSLTIYRKASGSYVGGRWTEGAETSFTWVANVQPPTIQRIHEEQKLLTPESNRTRDFILCLGTSTSCPRTMKENAWSADEILWQGERYEVLRIATYSMGVLNHVEVIAARVERTG